MDSIESIRKQINAIDREMAGLYEERMHLMADVADYKIKNDLPILDLKREESVIERNSALIDDPFLKPYYIEFIQYLMDQGKNIQEQITQKKSPWKNE